MALTAHKQLSLLQKSLYEKAYKEAHSFFAESNQHIQAYASHFEDALPNDFIRAGLKDVLDSFKPSSLILYGDFHTLKQSQKGLVRLIRSYIERSDRNNVVIAMEAFRGSDQDAIDDFLANRISERTFLEKTKYASHWGFPWPHYKLVLECAREFSLKVIGINSRNGGKDHLAFRDQFAARKLVAAVRANPKSTVICMIGESHLADEHLPKYLAEEFERKEMPASIARILTNVDKYFFKLQAMSPHLATEYLKIKDNFFCLINSPPWMKWQSYSIWEEMRSVQGMAFIDSEDEAQDEDYNEEGFDLDYQFLSLVKNLTKFLGLEISDSELSKFHINYSPELDFEKNIREEGVTTAKALESVLERVSLDGVFYLPKTRQVLLADLSINNTAEAASQLLFGHLNTAVSSALAPDESFYARCLQFASGMLGSKILNPRRKCPDLSAYSAFVKDNARKRLKGHAKKKREAARAVISHHTWLETVAHSLNGEKTKTPLSKGLRTFAEFDRRSDFELSRSIGYMLGQRIYKKTMAGQMPSHSIQSFFMPTNSSTPSADTLVRWYAAAFLK